MGALGKFLLAAARLAKQGVKEGDILNQAKREFGEVSEFMRAKIRKFYKDKDAPSIKNPSKNADVVPIKKDQGSGIMKTDEASPLMKNIDDVKQNIKGMSENSPKTFRMGEEQRNALGYPNRMIEGIIRTSAREILSKKGIDVSKADPIDTFADIFGVNSLERLEDISDELLLAQDYKQLNSILQKNDLYNVTPKSGLNLKQSDEIEELTEFDPTDRKPNSMGGMNRMNYAIGSLPKGIQALVKTINKKFGKDAVKTADEIDRPKNVQAFDDFEARNPDPKKQMTSDVDISQGMIDLDELNFTSNAKAAKEAIDNTSVNKEIKAGVDDIMKDTSPAGLEKSIEVDNLMLKYPGISRDLAKQIANDPDPARKAQVISMVEQTFKMSEKGMSGDEIIDTFKKGTDRTKQANGGLSYLMGM